MKVSFYAPLKPADHPVPSGDREMARLLAAALRSGGHVVDVASGLRTFMAEPDGEHMKKIEAAAEREVERIKRLWQADPDSVPHLWFSYHPFYKAPDLVGPKLAACFAIPYVTAEASHAPRRAHGPWRAWHNANEATLRAGAVHLCLTERDRSGLAALLGPSDRALVMLPPFMDPSPAPLPQRSASAQVRLICVAMMRPGDKLRSYAALAKTLAMLPDAAPWSLSIVGDGPARNAVQSLFDRFPRGCVTWLGQMTRPEIQAALAGSDLFVWPGHNEAYGMAYLEAGAAGLASLAFESGGVASVVQHGRTGLLVCEGDQQAYADALASLIADAALRTRLGSAARRWVLDERNLKAASGTLDRALSIARARTAA